MSALSTGYECEYSTSPIANEWVSRIEHVLWFIFDSTLLSEQENGMKWIFISTVNVNPQKYFIFLFERINFNSEAHNLALEALHGVTL